VEGIAGKQKRGRLVGQASSLTKKDAQAKSLLDRILEKQDAYPTNPKNTGE